MKRSPTLEMRLATNYGEVGAGRAVDNVVPFMSAAELIPVAVPASLKDSDIGAATVRGLSLTELGIFDGDTLVISKRFSWRDIDEDTICIVYIHATGELVAKRIVKGANMLTLRASGGGLRDQEYSPDEIEIRAIVLRVTLDVKTHVARYNESKLRKDRNGRT